MPHSSSAGAAGRAPAAPCPVRPQDVRDVVLVGHTGSGKTTLVEGLLAASGTVPRPGRVEDGTTVTDHDEAEKRQQRSVSLALAPLEHAGVKVNLLDAPGYADFVGDLRAGLRAADAALFVVSAVDGVDAATTMLWEECAAVGMPRAVLVTKLDKERAADFDDVVAICQRVFGDGVMPLYLPMAGDDGGLAGLLGLVTQTVYDYSSGSRTEREPDPEHVALVKETRDALIEGIIGESEDETLMDRYLAGEEIDEKVLVEDLEKAVARGSFHPVLPVCAPAGIGLREVLDGIVQGFPSPLEHPLPAVTTPEGDPRGPLTCDPDGPLVAEVVKTTTDPYVGRVSLVRVFSGTLRPDTVVHVSGHNERFSRAPEEEGHDVDERVGALSSPLGATQRPVPHAVAGDVCAVARLTRAETGDTLSSKDAPLLVEPWVMPEPLLPVALTATSKADEDKLAQGLGRLVAEDPTLRLVADAETGQLVLWCMGEAHLDVLLERLRGRYGVGVTSEPLRVALRETFAGPAHGRGRHVKQSGGHGQFAVCEIDVEPLPEGSGFEFVDRVVGGAVPRQFIASVEKGVRAQMRKGVRAGYPVVDLRVTLVDGKAHSVDSSDMAFQTAGALALKDAAAGADVHLLEPFDEVSVLVADEYVGGVMSDLSSRRGRVTGTEPVGSGRSLVRADVPQLELTRYAVDLRSVSHGTGSFTRSYARHEPMPPGIAARVVEGG
ncbi:elongation factor G-like protein EF-G2 [Vallicoccus soli]|uniref:Elongation factor G-like protein n=1 Tax=Vallicoccus soli TaxID=2339232 RepID=A0A3A3Z243_9ACTN|nr:elongation factor G-like protein EF-G2 [Vallicoccus soli]RJK96804.1 elongation factor G-like protein EF-G2 [Vallicoccus soli]